MSYTYNASGLGISGQQGAYTWVAGQTTTLLGYRQVTATVPGLLEIPPGGLTYDVVDGSYVFSASGMLVSIHEGSVGGPVSVGVAGRGVLGAFSGVQLNVAGTISASVSGLSVSGGPGATGGAIGFSLSGRFVFGSVGAENPEAQDGPGLGYFQAGDIVRILLSTPSPPDSAPTAVIITPASVALPTQIMGMNTGSTDWLVRFFLDGTAILGTYRIVFTFYISGVPYTSSRAFMVVPGGDIGGDVISMYAFTRPDSQYVLAQLTSGLVVCGRNPVIS